jgi:NNP family nitrate/nitrite transporter-like MFS transporter
LLPFDTLPLLLLSCTVFFTYIPMAPTQGFFWMGIMVIGMTSLYHLVYFPQWGGTFCPAKPGITEEDYYCAEYTPAERAEGLHNNSLKFAMESKSERGWNNLSGKDVGSDAPVKVVASGTI